VVVLNMLDPERRVAALRRAPEREHGCARRQRGDEPQESEHRILLSPLTLLHSERGPNRRYCNRSHWRRSAADVQNRRWRQADDEPPLGQSTSLVAAAHSRPASEQTLEAPRS